MAPVVKNLPANAGSARDMGSISGWGRSPGEGSGNPLQYSCLENSMDRGTRRATVHGVAKIFKKSGTSLVVEWLRLCAPNAGGMGLNPGLGTKIPPPTRCSQKKRRRLTCTPELLEAYMVPLLKLENSHLSQDPLLPSARKLPGFMMTTVELEATQCSLGALEQCVTEG